jgi:MFS family permease
MPGLPAGPDADEVVRDREAAEPGPVAYRGPYSLVRGSDFYGVWQPGSPQDQLIERFPLTTHGWFDARRRVEALDRLADGPDSSPIMSPRANRTALLSAAVVLGGVVLGVAGLFPSYLGGISLNSQVDQLLQHMAYLLGWSLVAALLLVERRFARGAAGLGVGVSLITFGFFLTDVLTASVGHGEGPGAGLYLSLAGWLICASGSVVALFALSSPTPRGRPAAWRHPLVVAGGVAALGAAVAFALPWDSYTVTSATTGSSQTEALGNIFANPGAIIAGNVVTMVLIVGVLVVAIAWRPAVVGVTILTGALVPLAAQVFATLAQPLPPLSEFGVTAAQAVEGQVSVAASYTGWFYLYCAFAAALVVLAGWIASNTSSAQARLANDRPGGSPGGE